MKLRSAPLLLLLILVSPLFLTQAVFYLHKTYAKWSIIRSLGKEYLIPVYLCGNGASPHISPHEDEFEMNGEMYDVVFREYAGDTTVLWCWHDARETSLQRYITSMIDETDQNSPGSQLINRLIDYFYSLYFQEHFIRVHTTASTKNLFCCHENHFTSFITLLHTPPPEVHPHLAVYF